MKVVVADNKKEQKKFLAFRKKLYKEKAKYVDNNYFMLQEIFSGKLSFTKNLKIWPVNIKDDTDNILCQGIICLADALPQYIQLCFFEALENQKQAVDILIEEAIRLGKQEHCVRLVIGLYGHVNYGLGLLNSNFDSVNSFSAPGNEEYYNEYFRSQGCEEILLNSYKIDHLDNRMDRYDRLLKKLYRNYSFRCFDKRQFEYYAKIYTDLNNICFVNHRYYYHRSYEDDVEMLKELFLFMKEDSLIFAFKDDKPIGFVLWYPDYNELCKKGDIFGAKHFFLNLFNNITTKKLLRIKLLQNI